MVYITDTDARLMGSETIKVFVGRKRKEFSIHKKLICQASKFFNDAFTGAFKEGQEGIMYMPEDDPDVFSCFVEWLYRNPLPTVEDNHEAPKKPVQVTKASENKEFGPITHAEHLQQVAEEKKELEERKKAQDVRLNEQYNKLLKLYFFAEKIFVNELKNRTMDNLRLGLAEYDKDLGHREIKQIYANTCPGSPLRQFCTELLLYSLIGWPNKKLDKLVVLQQEIPELAKDILVEVQSLSAFKSEMTSEWSDDGSSPDPRDRGLSDDFSRFSSCQFHTHDRIKGVVEGCHREDHSDMFNIRCVHCCVELGPHGSGCTCHF
jgi:hypothetical protein